MTEELEPKVVNLKPPAEWFELDGRGTFTQEPTPAWHFLLDRIESPQEGGIFKYYHGCHYPNKGFPFGEAMPLIDVSKKYLMFVALTFSTKEMLLPIITFGLLPKKIKIKAIQKGLDRFVILADYLMCGIYLKPRYRMKFALAIEMLFSTFLINIGISESTAKSIGKIIGTIFEYDDAYRYRVEDAFTMMTREEMIANPRKAMIKLAQIFAERDIQSHYKMIAVVKLAGYAFWLPWIGNAFKEAVRTVPFQDLQLDDADTYHCHLRTGYNFFGMKDEERIEKWYEMHPEGIPIQVQYVS